MFEILGKEQVEPSLTECSAELTVCSMANPYATVCAGTSTLPGLFILISKFSNTYVIKLEIFLILMPYSYLERNNLLSFMPNPNVNP